MNCCESIKDIGCIYSCDIVQIGITTPETGDYTLVLLPDLVKIVKTANTAGSPLVFAAGYLNEDAISTFKILKPDGEYLVTSAGEDCFKVDIKPANDPSLANIDIIPVSCDPATAVLKNTSGVTISTTSIASGASQDIEAPDATAVIKNSDGATLDTEAIPSGDSEDIIVGNSNVNKSDGTLIAAVPATQNYNVADSRVSNSDDSYDVDVKATDSLGLPDIQVTDSDGSTGAFPAVKDVVCTPSAKDATIVFNPIEIGDDTSGEFTNSGTALTLTAISDDGGSGTITVSVNGGAYAAFVNPTLVANGETLQVRRTTTTGVGTVTLTGTYA